jgi:pimeloyl-ACP methyl ester carboxylesterase
MMDGDTQQESPGTGNTGFYKNPAGRAAAHRSYDAAMTLWSTPWEEEWVEGSFGRTHLITAGDPDARPLFLLPGLFADATMWYANAGALAGSCRIIAPDLPVYGGKSEAGESPIKGAADYAGWFTEILAYYQYRKTAVAGLSYGSWLALALAREIPESIAAVIMLDPSETFAKMRASMAWKGIRYFVLFPSRLKYKKFFDWMGGGYSDSETDIWMEHMLDVIEYGSVGMMEVPQHRVYKPEELTMVRMPVLVLAGGKPIIYKDPAAFAAAASRALPHAEIEIIPETGHSLHVEKAALINERMIRFLHENHRPNSLPRR